MIAHDARHTPEVVWIWTAYAVQACVMGVTGVGATSEGGVVGGEQGVQGSGIDMADGVCAWAHRRVDGGWAANAASDRVLPYPAAAVGR